MGGTFDPQALLSFLKASQGDPSGYQNTQVQPIGAPNAGGNQMQPINAPPSGVAFSNPQPPPVPQANQSAQPTQQQQRISGVKGYLSNFLYGVGEAMKAHAGLETDAQRQQREYNNQLNQQKMSMEQQNTQAAITQHLATVQQTQLQNQLIQNRLNAIKQLSSTGNDAFAQLGQLSPEEQALKSSAYSEAVMKGDMEPIFNAVKSIAQQRAIFGRTTRGEVTVTPDMADQHPELKPFIGKLVSVSNVASLKRSEAPFAPTVSNTTQTIELSDGTIVQVPKTTTTQKITPGGTGPSGTPTPAIPGVIPTPGKPVSLSTRGGVKTLVDANGNPLRGKGSAQMMVGTDAQGRQIAGTPQEMTAAGATNFTKLDSGEAAKVNTARQMTSPGGLFDLINKDFSQFKPGELEGLAPRWNEFLAGTYGTADPRYVALRTHLTGLLSTALMQAHVGARGGERIMEHFQDLANAGKMSLPTMKAAVEAERQYVEEKAMRPTAAAPQGNFPPAGAKIRDYTSFK